MVRKASDSLVKGTTKRVAQVDKEGMCIFSSDVDLLKYVISDAFLVNEDSFNLSCRHGWLIQTNQKIYIANE